MNRQLSGIALLLLLACAVTLKAQHAVPFSPDTLPPNFSGDDPVMLLRQLLDLRKRLVKNEFETTAAYQARIPEEKKKPILANQAVDGIFRLVAHNVQAEYDADTQMMSFTLPVQTNFDAEGLRSASVDTKIMTDLSRVAMYQVSLGGEKDPYVLFNSAVGLAGAGNNQKFSATAKLDVEAARRLKTGTKAVLYVRFEEPYATRDYNEGGQFMTRVMGVQFFDQQTGKVLGQSGSAEAASQIKQAEIQSKPNPDYASYGKNPTFKRPRILAKPDAGYTEDARRNKISGQVVLHVMFAETGQVTNISVVQGLPDGLTERAIAAARLIRFEPAELDGNKVAYPIVVVYNFRRH